MSSTTRIIHEDFFFNDPCLENAQVFADYLLDHGNGVGEVFADLARQWNNDWVRRSKKGNLCVTIEFVRFLWSDFEVDFDNDLITIQWPKHVVFIRVTESHRTSRSLVSKLCSLRLQALSNEKRMEEERSCKSSPEAQSN